MNHVSRSGSRVLITQVPWKILIAFLLLSLPLIGYGLFCILGGRDADGEYFLFFFGTVLLWAGLEFAATIERIEVDPEARTIQRTVRGVFRRRVQTASYEGATGFTVQWCLTLNNQYGRRGQFLFLHGPEGEDAPQHSRQDERQRQETGAAPERGHGPALRGTALGRRIRPRQGVVTWLGR